jgi:hypothetical protein
MEGGLVAYQPGSERVHFLNHTGALVIELCNGQHTVTEIVGIVQASFGLEQAPDTEVRELLQQAIDEGLIS